MPIFARIGPSNRVTHVIIAASAEWCAQRHPEGGAWVETFQEHPSQKYAGKGDRYDEATEEKFFTE